MSWPTSQDYNEAIQNGPAHLSDPDLKRGEVVLNAMGLPVPRSGNFADVYQFKGGDGKMWAIKCFTRKVAGLQERYAKIDDHLTKAKLPFTVGFKYLPEGIRVRNDWFPLLKMEWVEGFTLNDFVADNLDKPNYLHALMQMWGKLAARLRDANMAHADLQHGNVLLVPGATPSKLGLKLIDYDGMWVPALAENHSGEVGHPNFQHPARLKERQYNAEVDRFPHLVIAAGLRATLVGGKAIWNKFDNSDNLLFRESDLRDPANAPIFKTLWELNDPVLRTLVGHIALSAKQPLRKTPWLDDLLFDEAGVHLTADQEKQVADLLGVKAATPGVKSPAAAAAVQSQFNVFEFQEDETDQQAFPAGPATSRRSYKRKTDAARSAGQKSKAPLLVGIGVAFVAIIGIVVAMSAGKKAPTEVVENTVKEKEKEKEKTKTPEPIGKKENHPITKELPEPKKTPPVEPRPPADQPPDFASKPAVAVFPIPRSNDVLFISRGDGTLYSTESHGATKPKAIGRHEAPLRALAGTSDGARAVTGGEDGSVRVWLLKDAKSTVPTPGGRKFIQSYAKIAAFQGDYGYTAYSDSVDMRNNTTGKVETVTAGKAGHEVKSGFKALIGKTDKLAERLGEALTDEVSILDGALVAQLFDGGVMLFEKQSQLMWYSHHAKRSSGAPPAPKEPAPAPKALKTKVSGPAMMTSFPGEYEYTLFQEGLLIRDTKTGKEETVFAGRPITSSDGPFKQLIENPKSPFGEPVSAATPIFDGTITAQVFRHGFLVNKTGTTRDWNLNIGGNHLPIGDPAPAEKDGGPPAQDPKETPEPTGTARILKEHTRPVIAVAVAPDDKTAASIGEDGVVCVWDIVGEKLIRKFAVADPTALAYLPDARSIVVGTRSASAGVWDVEKGERVRELPDHPGAVTSLCVNAKGDRAYAGGDDGAVRIWDIAAGRMIKSFEGTHKGSVRALMLSPDNKLLVAAGADGFVRFLSPNSGKQLGESPADNPRHFLAFLNDGNRMLVGRESFPLQLRVVKPEAPSKSDAFRLVHDVDAPEAPSRIGFNDDGKLIWVIGKGAVTILDGTTGKELKTIPIEGQIRDVDFGANNELFVSMLDGKFQNWDWEKAEVRRETEQKMPPVARIHGTLDPNRLLVSTFQPTLMWWNVAEWKVADRFTPFPNQPCVFCSLFPDGKRVLLGTPGANPRLGVWDLEKNRESFTLESVELKQSVRAEVSPNGKWIVAHGSDNGGQFCIWDAQSGKLKHTLPGMRALFLGFGFTAGGDNLIVCEPGPRRSIIDLETGKVVEEMSARIGATTAAVCPAASLLATVDSDRRIRIWHIEIDTKSAAPVRVAKTPDPKTPPEPKVTPKVDAGKQGHLLTSDSFSDGISGCAFASDGKKIYVTNSKGMVLVLDSGTLKETANFSVSRARILSMTVVHKVVLPSGANPERLYILDSEKRVHIWDPETKKPVKTVNLQQSIDEVTTKTQITVVPGETFMTVLEPGGFNAGISWDLKRSIPGGPPVLQRNPFSTDTRVIAFSPDQRYGAAFARGNLLVWDIRTARDSPIRVSLGCRWLGISPEASAVVGTDRDKLIAWNLKTGKEMFDITPHGKNFANLHAAIMPKTTGIVTYSDKTMKVLDLQNGNEVAKWTMDETAAYLAISTDGRFALTANTESNRLHLFGLPPVGVAKKP